MDRRAFIAAVAGGLLYPQRGDGATTCQQSAWGAVCRAQVRFESAMLAYAPQEESQLCWAACISMIFAYHGRPVSQRRIVSEAYGAPVNMPAGSGLVIARQLNRQWQDDRGRAFSSRVAAAYDFDAGVNALNNAMIVSELDRERPLVIGTTSHAVVVTAVDFLPTPAGPNIQAVGVFDPWPGIGMRALTGHEMRPMHLGGGLRFAATVHVR